MIPFLFGTQIPSHTVCIDVYNPDTAKVQPLELPVLLASDVVHAIWERSSPKLWDIFIGCTAEKSRTFWSSFATDPAFANHPVLQLLSSIDMFFLNLVYDTVFKGYQLQIQVRGALFQNMNQAKKTLQCCCHSRSGLEAETFPVTWESDDAREIFLILLMDIS